MSVRTLLKTAIQSAGYEIRRQSPVPDPPAIPNGHLYKPLYAPWDAKDFDRYFQRAAPRTLVSRDRCFVLSTLLKQALSLDGDIWECGVYKGGTAAMLADIIREQRISH